MVLSRGKKKLSHSDQQSGGITKVEILPWGTKDLSTTSGTTNLRFCTKEMNPQNNWLWKPTRNTMSKIIELQGTENTLLKGLHTDSTQKTVQKHQFEKCISYRWRGSTYQTWSVCQRGRNEKECSPGTETLVRAIFETSGYFINASAGVCYFITLPLII